MGLNKIQNIIGSDFHSFQYQMLIKTKYYLNKTIRRQYSESVLDRVLY